MATKDDELRRKFPGFKSSGPPMSTPATSTPPLKQVDINKTPLGPTSFAGRARAPGPLPASVPAFRTVSSSKADSLKAPVWLTKESHPTMGWQQRTAINKELAANYRQRLDDINNLEVKGLETTSRLKERGMIEEGLGSRQQAGFGHETGMQASRQAFQTSEREATQGFQTGEREAKQLFDAEQGVLRDRRKLGADIYLASGDPGIAENVINDPGFGHVDLGDTALPKKRAETPYKYIKGRTETIYGKSGLQTKEYPDRVFDESQGVYYDLPSGIPGDTPGISSQPGQVIDLSTMSESELQALKKRKELERAMLNAEQY